MAVVGVIEWKSTSEGGGGHLNTKYVLPTPYSPLRTQIIITSHAKNIFATDPTDVTIKSNTIATS
jgi:hypothetical protein